MRASYQTTLRTVNASAHGALHSMPRRRRVASNVDARNQERFDWLGNAASTWSTFRRAIASVSGTYRLGGASSPSYLGTSYSRIRWSRQVFQVRRAIWA